MDEVSMWLHKWEMKISGIRKKRCLIYRVSYKVYVQLTSKKQCVFRMYALGFGIFLYSDLNVKSLNLNIGT